MDIEYRKLTENELETFIQMRIAQLREEGAKEDIDLPALVAELEKSQSWDRFFELVLGETAEAFREGRLGLRMTQYITDCINDAVIKGGTLNQTRRLTFDYVVNRIREVNR